MMDPINAMNDSERLRLVSSLYGPGAVSCWLCVVLSVLTTWLFNKKAGKRDTLTNDLIGALTMPIVASGHLIYQIVIYQGDRSKMLTTEDPQHLPRIAAIEAALTICESSAALAILLFVVAAFKIQIKRCAAVAATGFICFGVESILFLISPRSSIGHSNFSRPFILNEQSAMILSMTVSSFLAFGTIMGMIRYRMVVARMRTDRLSGDNRSNQTTVELGPVQPGTLGHTNQTPSGTQHQSQDNHRHAVVDEMRRKAAATQFEKKSLRPVTIMSTVVMPLAFMATLSFPLGAWGVTTIGELHSFSWRLRFFIPESLCRFSNLDQAVALGGGVATLGLSCYDAFKSHGEGEDSSDE